MQCLLREEISWRRGLYCLCTGVLESTEVPGTVLTSPFTEQVNIIRSSERCAGSRRSTQSEVSSSRVDKRIAAYLGIVGRNVGPAAAGTYNVVPKVVATYVAGPTVKMNAGDALLESYDSVVVRN